MVTRLSPLRPLWHDLRPSRKARSEAVDPCCRFQWYPSLLRPSAIARWTRQSGKLPLFKWIFEGEDDVVKKNRGHLQGILTEIFFWLFYAQNDLILKIEQKNFFWKKYFRKKNFWAPQKWPFSAISWPNKVFLTCGFLQKFKFDLFFRFKPFPDKTNAKFFS